MTERYPEEMTAERSAWLRGRANELRQKWTDHKTILADASSSISQEIERLREVDEDAPFMVLTILLERELGRKP